MNASVFVCMVLLLGFAVCIPWAVRLDRADQHTIHRPGTCGECDSDE